MRQDIRDYFDKFVRYKGESYKLIDFSEGEYDFLDDQYVVLEKGGEKINVPYYSVYFKEPADGEKIEYADLDMNDNGGEDDWDPEYEARLKADYEYGRSLMDGLAD